MKTFIVTELQYRQKKITAAAFSEEGRITDLRVEEAGNGSLISCVFRGTVSSVVKNIRGAFVDIDGTKAFLPFSGSERITASTPCVVQVTKDASGIKAPVVTTNIHISGKYAVISKVSGPVSFSAKLTAEQKTIISAWLSDTDPVKYRILVRTNAAKAAKSEFLSEIQALSGRLDRIFEDAKQASSGALLYAPDPFYITMLRDSYDETPRLVSDIPAYAEKMAAAAGKSTDEILYVRGSRLLALEQLYGIRETLDHLTRSHVWLKSGAYLVIERTEAFVSIDVNTGKCLRGRIPEETYRRINQEAAAEISKQIRLRNLSGMILVDFISMESEDHNNELIGVMRKLVKKDHIHTEIVDITPLGIMEIVRQKVRKPLEEELGL